jgi:CheY-like chemotaxis protein
MRVRRLLLVHPVRSTRGLIKKYIFSELSDIEVHEAQCGQDAVSLRPVGDFDVIVAADELKDMSITEFKQSLESKNGRAPVPLIIISESESAHVRNELVEQGFDRVVQIRVKPSDLIHKINAVCDPRTWRKDARFHLPNVGVQIEVQDRRIEAKLINISKGGILVELSCEQPARLMGDHLQLALTIPLDDA